MVSILNAFSDEVDFQFSHKSAVLDGSGHAMILIRSPMGTAIASPRFGSSHMQQGRQLGSRWNRQES